MRPSFSEASGLEQLVDRPFLAGGGFAADGVRGEAVEGGVVGGVDGDELALEVGGKLGHLEVERGECPLDFVAIGLAFRGLGEVEQAGVPGRDLQAGVAEVGGPFGHAGQGVEGGFVAGELGEEDAGALDVGFHAGALAFGLLAPKEAVAGGKRFFF